MAKHNLGMVTAYAYAVAGGYTGTEAEFEALLGNIATDLEEIENLTVTATTLPEGSSATASYSDGVLTLGIPKGDTGATGAGATATAGTTTTGASGSDAIVVNSGTTKDAVFDFTIPRGNTGNGIDSITLTSTVGAVHTYTITFTDGDTTTFDVTDGEVTNDALTAILADYAKTDGAYESMTVGNAEQLISSVYVTDEEPYQFRTSGGSADIGDREFDTLVGGSVAWNQLVDNTNKTTQTINGVTFTVLENGAIKANGTASADAIYDYNRIDFLKGHVYLSVGVPSGASSTTYYVVTTGAITADTIYKCSQDDYWGSRILVKEGTTVNDVVFCPMCFDLTQLFGSTIADYIYTLEQGTAGAGVAFFRKYFPNMDAEYTYLDTDGETEITKKLRDYQQGVILSVEGVSAHITTGKNLTQNPTKRGYWAAADGAFITNNTWVSTEKIKVLPNTQYTLSSSYITRWVGAVAYDMNGNFLTNIGENSSGSSHAVNLTFTTPSNCYYIGTSFASPNSASILPSVITDLQLEFGTTATTYEPYKEHSYPLDDSLTLRGIPKIANGKLYYDGDTYESDGTVTRNTILRAYQSGDESLANAITDGTNTVVYSANASTETADTFVNPQIVDDFGTEEYVTTSIVPVGHSTKYTNNLKAKLEMSPDSPSGDGDYIVRQTSGTNEYVPLGSTNTISSIIARLEALENA